MHVIVGKALSSVKASARKSFRLLFTLLTIKALKSEIWVGQIKTETFNLTVIKGDRFSVDRRRFQTKTYKWSGQVKTVRTRYCGRKCYVFGSLSTFIMERSFFKNFVF